MLFLNFGSLYYIINDNQIIKSSLASSRFPQMPPFVFLPSPLFFFLTVPFSLLILFTSQASSLSKEPKQGDPNAHTAEDGRSALCQQSTGSRHLIPNRLSLHSLSTILLITNFTSAYAIETKTTACGTIRSHSGSFRKTLQCSSTQIMPIGSPSLAMIHRCSACVRGSRSGFLFTSSTRAHSRMVLLGSSLK